MKAKKILKRWALNTNHVNEVRIFTADYTKKGIYSLIINNQGTFYESLSDKELIKLCIDYPNIHDYILGKGHKHFRRSVIFINYNKLADLPRMLNDYYCQKTIIK